MAVRRAAQVLSLFAFILLSSSLWSDSQARIVRLSLVEGDVEMDRGDGTEYAILNSPVVQGTTIATPDEARAEIEFENGSTIRLTDYSQIAFEELSLRSSGGKVNLVRVDSGTVYFRFRDVKREDDIRVVCGGMSFRVLRSSHFRVDLAGGGATIAVFGGKLEMEGAAEQVEIGKGETLRLNLQDEVTYAKERGTESLPSDEWERDRDREYSEYARNRYGYDGYGASDLNRYGDWHNVNGYGYVWRPRGMPMDWDPFGHGFWTEYAACGGYTWVSPDPWGWAPYRFGQWIWVDGLGWVWFPGPMYARGSYSWHCGPSFHGYIPPIYTVPVAPPPRDLSPVRVRRPPRILVVGNPPNVPRRWAAPGRPFPGGTTNTPVAGKADDPRRKIESPPTGRTTNPRPIRSLDDGEVLVRDRVLQVKPSRSLDSGRTTKAPTEAGSRPATPVRPADQGVADPPVRSIDGPRPVQPRNPQKIDPGDRTDTGRRTTSPATTNVAPQPRPAPQPRTDPPARSAPPVRVDSPVRTAPPVHVDRPSHSSPPPSHSAPAPSHSNPAPAPHSSGGYSGGASTGHSGGGRSTPPPSGGRK